MVLSSGAVLWGKGFSPQASSTASSNSSFYPPRTQTAWHQPLLENAGFCIEEGPCVGSRWKGDAGGGTGRRPALGSPAGRLPASGLSSSVRPSAKSAGQRFAWWRNGRVGQRLWHGGVENGRRSKWVGGGRWGPPRASHTAYSTGMPKREASGVAACSLSSGVLVRDLFGKRYPIHSQSSNANVWEGLFHLFCVWGMASHREQSPDFQTNLGTHAPVSSPGVPEELCDSEGTEAGLAQIAPRGSSFPPRARSCRRGGGSRMGTGTCCRGGTSSVLWTGRLRGGRLGLMTNTCHW